MTYEQHTKDLIEWFGERLPALGPFTITEDEYMGSAGNLPQPYLALVDDAIIEWDTKRDYGMPEAQLTFAFYAAAIKSDLITLVRAN